MTLKILILNTSKYSIITNTVIDAYDMIFFFNMGVLKTFVVNNNFRMLKEMLGLYLNTLIIGYKYCNMFSLLNELLFIA